MLISPPFLPPRTEHQSDDEWIDIAMHGGTPGHGAFPVSFNLGWHGGIHLFAPELGNGYEPVRAIADGTVVFVRRPTEGLPRLPADHPLMYGNATSDGTIIIRHETEIGDGESAKIVFYSIYVHLHEIPAAIQAEHSVYRKDMIGRPGYINGQRGQIHFEIICDDANLARLMGRTTGNLSTTSSGRKDAVYGEIYFSLPRGTLVFAEKPAANTVTALSEPQRTARNVRMPPHRLAEPAYTTTEEFIVGLSYADSVVIRGNRGTAYVTTYENNGTVLGSALEEPEAEYKIYGSANDISNAYPAEHRPMPSAVYELLRFGRVIGSDQLTPRDVPHWRKVSYPGGQGWVNLNADNVHRFSDADFPHWKRWCIIDDSTNQDSRCDSSVLRGWLDANHDSLLPLAEVVAKMNDADTSTKLAKVVAKFHTEWDSSGIEARWSWLKSTTNENPRPLSDGDFTKFRAHIAALAFWSDGINMSSEHWHWQPREFIRHFRKCGWLSTRELAQCIPRNCLGGTTEWSAALQRANTHNVPLNHYFRKYYGASRQRHVHALSQIYIETGMLRLINETGTGNHKSYGPLFGRGYLQLTWGLNYERYGKYKAIPDHVGPYVDPRITPISRHAKDMGGTDMQWYPRYDPDIVASDLGHAGESSGFYWVTKSFRGVVNMNRVADLPFSLVTVGFTSWLVNGGDNGYVDRQQFAMLLKNYFFDAPLLIGRSQFSYPPLTPRVNLGTAAHPNWSPLLCSTFPPTEVPYSSTGTINYEHQRP